MRLVAVYVYLLGWNVPRSPDPAGLSRDPSKVGRYLDGMWMGARVGTGTHWQERSAAVVTGGRQAGYAAAAACSAAFCMNVIQASLDWDSAPDSGGTISMLAASAGVRSPMPACGLKKLW